MTTYKTYADVQQQTNKSILTNAQKAANITIWSSTIFLVLVTALHFIKSEFDPSWRFLSEYAIGNNGWIMQIAFFMLAISCFSAIASIRSQIFTKAGKVGLWIFGAVALSVVVAGIFVMDPITSTNPEPTTNSMIHGFASMIGVPLFPVAALLVSYSLKKKNSYWKNVSQKLVLTAWLILLFTLFMNFLVFAALSKSGGKLEPGTIIGWANRLLVLTYCIWLIIVAAHNRKLSLYK